ncbi:MAG: hypothetical protein N2690_01600 [Rhodocyclaceae bacterium]|nr:hypothetical protein [Rhodocyclaceae bacterium]
MSLLLGQRIPLPEHFETDLALEIFEDEPDWRPALPSLMEIMLIEGVGKLLLRVGSRNLASVMPLLMSFDRFVFGRLSADARRRFLAQVCDLAPQALAAMPRANEQVRVLSRAIFLAGVLNPAALQRIEAAIRAEGLLKEG